MDMGEKQTSRVLIVDDMRVNRMILSSLLASNGVTSDMAESGRECLDLVNKNTYDLILLDHRMPDMDGVDTLVALKEIFEKTGRQIPVICHTTDDGKKNINLYKAAGFADVLIKPIQPQHLSDILLTYLPNGKQTVQDKEAQEKEKINKEIGNLPDWLKNVKGLNLFSGVEHCETAEDYLDALNVFAASITEKADEIGQFLADQDWQKFTLKVHSLKSMARVVGAEKLAELAADLEAAGKNEDISFIRENTSGLLEDYRALRTALAGLFEDGEKEETLQPGELASRETLDDAYTTIAELAAVYDEDSIRMVLDSLKKYQLLPEDAARVNAVSRAVSDADWDVLRKLLENR